MADLRRVYMDSTAFIDMVKVDTSKTLPQDRVNDAWNTKWLLEAHRDKEVAELRVQGKPEQAAESASRDRP